MFGTRTDKNSRDQNEKRQSVVFWGTYDLGKPRVRLLLNGARAMGLEVIECHTDIWKGVEDKSRLSGMKSIHLLIACLCSYPSLILRYMRLPTHDAVIVSYLGHFDVIVLWPFAFLRGVPILWDAFLSLYDTVVCDRRLVSKKSPLAVALYCWEWLACHMATKIFLDTKTHARFFETLYKLPEGSVGRVFVGAETDIFFPRTVTPEGRKDRSFSVLFYGQFIPLHGIDIIVRAAKEAGESDEHIQWIIVGQGQEKERIDSLIDEMGLKNIERIPWVSYTDLPDLISSCDVCLGIFGHSGKTRQVIPNKVYQILACQKPLITADTSAIRELCDTPTFPFVQLVPPGDSSALASAVLRIKHGWESRAPVDHKLPIIGPQQVGLQLTNILRDTLSRM